MARLPVNTLSRRAKSKSEPLGLAPAPEPIPAVRNVAVRVAAVSSSSGGGGQNWPWTEQPYDGSIFHYLVSSDGLQTFESPAKTTYSDADQVEGDVVHNPPA